MENTTLSFLICAGSYPWDISCWISSINISEHRLRTTSWSCRSGNGQKAVSQNKTTEQLGELWAVLISPQPLRTQIIQRHRGLNINIFMSLLCLGQNWSGQSTGWAQGNWTIKGNSRTEREKSSSWSVDVKFRALVAVTVTHLVTGLM